MTRLSRCFLPIAIVRCILAGCTDTSRQLAGLAYKAHLSWQRRSANLVRKEIDLPGGLHYVYLEGGQGEPLMLLHGFGGSKDNFARVAKFLTPHYRVIIPDHIGFGESSRPQETDYTPAAQAARLRTLAQALGISRLHLGGNSMGGFIALSYAAHYGAEVDSLWLVDAAGVQRSAPNSELAEILEKTGRNPLIITNGAELKKALALAMSDPPYVPRPLLDYMAQEHSKNASLQERILQQLLAAETMEKKITGLATPTLIVWGEHDRLLHVGNAEVLHKLMPRSEVIIMPDIGHAPMIERPQRSAEDYLQFRTLLACVP